MCLMVTEKPRFLRDLLTTVYLLMAHFHFPLHGHGLPSVNLVCDKQPTVKEYTTGNAVSLSRKLRRCLVGGGVYVALRSGLFHEADEEDAEDWIIDAHDTSATGQRQRSSTPQGSRFNVGAVLKHF